MKNDIKIIDEVDSIYKQEWLYNLKEVIDYFSDRKLSVNDLLDKEVINSRDIKKIKTFKKDKYITIDYIGVIELLKVIIYFNNEKTIKYKEWLVSVAIERLKELKDPNITLDRINTLYYKKGYNTNFTFVRKNRLENNKLVETDIQKIFVEELNCGLIKEKYS